MSFPRLCALLSVAGAISCGLLTSSANAATPEEQSVLSPVKAMFDGMAKRDAAAIKKPLLPGGQDGTDAERQARCHDI